MTGAFSIQQSFPLDIPAGKDTVLTIVYYPINIETGYITDILTINSDINSDTLVQRIAIQVDLMGRKEDNKLPGVNIPIDEAVNVPTDTVFYVEFSEPVRMLGGRYLNYENADSLIVFKKDGKNGDDVPFDAVISSGLDRITIQLDSALDESQVYFLAISDQLEDYSGNQVSSETLAFFSTGDSIYTSLNARESDIIRVYPNPGNGLYHVNLPSSSRYDLSVFSMEGRLVFQRQDLEGAFSFNLSELPGKFYILRISNKTNSELYIRKLIKL